MKIIITIILIALIGIGGCISLKTNTDPINWEPEIVKTNEEWRQILTPEQYEILREKGTEKPFTGEYLDNKEDGIYLCAGCENQLFSSDTKFDSGSGWPSFYDIISDRSIVEKKDFSLGTSRTEVLCQRCGGHLGHVFEDGPRPTRLRYCVNSASLKFVEK